MPFSLLSGHRSVLHAKLHALLETKLPCGAASLHATETGQTDSKWVGRTGRSIGAWLGIVCSVELLQDGQGDVETGLSSDTVDWMTPASPRRLTHSPPTWGICDWSSCARSDRSCRSDADSGDRRGKAVSMHAERAVLRCWGILALKTRPTHSRFVLDLLAARQEDVTCDTHLGVLALKTSLLILPQLLELFSESEIQERGSWGVSIGDA